MPTFCLLAAEAVSSANAVMFHHHDWVLDDETWGEAGGCPPSPWCHHCPPGPLGLSHNIHVYHSLILLVKFPLVMFTHLVDPAGSVSCVVSLFIFLNLLWEHLLTKFYLKSYPYFASIAFVYFLCMYVFVVHIINKIKSLVWECTEIPGGECHRHEIWVKEKMTSFGSSYIKWGFWWQHQHMCRWPMVFPLCMHSGFPMERVEQMIVTSLDDLTMITHTIEGGKYIRRAHLGFGAVIWVFWHWTVWSIVKPLTLYSSYISASHGTSVYSGWNVFLVYFCACTQTLWEHFS